ncbi:MAG: DUF4919 domain-containing protein [Prevotella sp.]|nr:DUF4919 domain-containing protein [Prevotella sp.]MCM1436440.1 DUF4919 domain-containing protein [Prevotella sp.]
MKNLSAGKILRIAAVFLTAFLLWQGVGAQSRSAKNNDNKRKVKVEKPNLEKIEDETLDPASPFYFPKLLAKYNRNDTVMTPEEYRYFYLGYMFQEDYDPYRVSPYSTKTDDLRLKATHTKEEIDTIRKYAELSLADNPFDLRQMSFLVHVLKEKNKGMSAKIWEYRLEHLLGAIKSTGTGEDMENAWYVIYPAHEYDMVSLLGYDAIDVEYPDDGFDRLIVQPDPARKVRENKRGFYFNVGMPSEQYELKHPEDAMEEVEEEEIIIPQNTNNSTPPAQEVEDPDDAPAEE